MNFIPKFMVAFIKQVQLSLKTVNPSLLAVVSQLRTVCCSYINLANITSVEINKWAFPHYRDADCQGQYLKLELGQFAWKWGERHKISNNVVYIFFNYTFFGVVKELKKKRLLFQQRNHKVFSLWNNK